MTLSKFFLLFVNAYLDVYSSALKTEWHNLTDADTKLLEDAITQSDQYKQWMRIFQASMIPPELRWIQLGAHNIYDQLSPRELSVFKKRTSQHSFPVIAEALGISVSSAKTYWRRALSKCQVLLMSPITSNNDEC